MAIDAAEPAPVGVTVAVADVRPSDAKVNVCDVVESPTNVNAEKVTVPPTAFTVVAPDNVPVEALTVTAAVDDVTVLP